MLQHPVLWQFVSAPFPTRAVVKSRHTISWVMKQSVRFFGYFPLWRAGPAGGELLGAPGGGSNRGPGSPESLRLCDSARSKSDS